MRTYTLYATSIIFGFFLAFLTTDGENSQLIDENIAVGYTAHADAPYAQSTYYGQGTYYAQPNYSGEGGGYAEASYSGGGGGGGIGAGGCTSGGTSTSGGF